MQVQDNLFDVESFGVEWLKLQLPFECEIHHTKIKTTPSQNRYSVLNLAGEPSVFNYSLTELKKMAHLFDLITTTNEDLLSFPNARLVTFGSSWVESYPQKKRFELSFLYSGGIGIDLDGYELRNEIWQIKQDLKIPIVFWTSNFPGRRPNVKDLNPYQYDSKIQLFESMFTIAIENTSEKNFFTEKIIDCFQTYTIPIYYGCPNISDFFQQDGIIFIENARQSVEIINTLTESYYWERIGVMHENRLKSNRYRDFNQVLKECISRSYSNGLFRSAN